MYCCVECSLRSLGSKEIARTSQLIRRLSLLVSFCVSLKSGPHDWSRSKVENAGHAPQFHDDNGFDDSTGPEWNYVGAKYVPVGNEVYCHRATPTGKRDCNGHKADEGLIARAHSQGALVYPSIGGWSLSDTFPEMTANAAARRNFAKNCVGLIREYNFDGIGKKRSCWKIVGVIIYFRKQMP